MNEIRAVGRTVTPAVPPVPSRPQVSWSPVYDAEYPARVHGNMPVAVNQLTQCSVEACLNLNTASVFSSLGTIKTTSFDALPS